MSLSDPTRGSPKLGHRLSLILTGVVIFLGAALGFLLISANVRSAIASPEGISSVSNKGLPWDFANVWLGGRLALEGRLEVIFDVNAYREELRGMFSPSMDDSEWSYPPLALLLGVPLATMPLYLAYALWTLLRVALLVLVCRLLGLPWLGCAFLLVSPGVLLNVLFGQNGAVTSSLVLAGLWLSTSAPRTSGASFGLLTFKPQLGLLLPVALVAAGRWAALAWAAAAGALLAGLTLLLFGSETWHGFLTVTRPLMLGILDAPFGQGYHANAITFFAFLRSQGAGLPLAYGLQAVLTLAALAVTVVLWRRPTSDPALRCITMGPLALLATPYAFAYDMVLVSVAALFLFVRNGYRLSPLLAIVWIWPVMNNLVARHGIVLAPFILLLATALCLADLRRRSNATSVP
jgi:hypothetical protein